MICTPFTYYSQPTTNYTYYVKAHAHEIGQNKILLEEWHVQSNKLSSRLRIAFLKSHSLLSPLLFSGTVGFISCSSSE